MRHLTLFLLLCGACWAQSPDGSSANRSFWILTGANAGATAADAWSTLQLTKPHVCDQETGAPYLYGVHPTVGRTAGWMAAQVGLSTGLSYLLKRKKVQVWKFQLWSVPMAWNTVAHARGFLLNAANCQ